MSQNDHKMKKPKKIETTVARTVISNTRTKRGLDKIQITTKSEKGLKSVKHTKAVVPRVPLLKHNLKTKISIGK